MFLLAAAYTLLPLDSYRMCISGAGSASIIAYISTALAFGKDFSQFPIPLTEPSVRFPRSCSFCARHCSNTTHQINAPRSDCVEHSRHSRQGRGDILRGHIFVPFIYRYYVLYGEGELFAQVLEFNVC